MKKTSIYLFLAFVLLLAACDKDSSNSGCLCVVTLNGQMWSQQNVADCSTCFAPQGYSANCNCD